MKSVREILQTEIWSSRTTKKIVVIVLVLLVFGGAISFLDEYWMNPSEHRAAEEMFKRAEMVRTASRDDIAEKLAIAKESEDIAEKKVWTFRDQYVEFVVSDLIAPAKACRDGELNPVLTRPEDTKAQRSRNEEREQMATLMCNMYEMEETASRHLLNTRLGF
jgi:hypothetical protein